MSHVVIVESPAKCSTIGKYLGKDYKVLASYGHIRDLPSKEGSVRPDEDFAIDYEVSSSSNKHAKIIVDEVKKADSIILATDPDREGEAISWHVLEILKQKKVLKDKKIQRVVFSSITKKAVTEAMETPRDIDMDLVNAQQARRALDYLVGFTLSPVLWRKLPGSKSAGRVQSVALRIICDREAEISRFVPEEFWDITARFEDSKKQAFQAKLTQLDGEKLDKFALPNEKEAKKAEKIIESGNFSVGPIEKKQVKRNPYAPFTTSTLQQEASRKLGFGATRTMRTAQKLYEGIELGGDTTGLITYMRTDGVTVAPEAINATRNTIQKKFGDKYVPEKPRLYQSKAKNAQEAHEAIRPTDPSRTPESVANYLDEDQLKLYDLIWKRLLASQMATVIMDQVGVDLVAQDGSATLRATGSTIVFDGFYRLYKEDKDDGKDEDEEKRLPPLTEGDALKTLEINPEQHFTQPPPRFSEASLVKKMEELGIGRPSTYASILSILQDRGYVKLEKKRFIPEERGRLVTAFLEAFFTKYVEYDFTAKLEEELDDISAGSIDWKKVLHDFWKDFSLTSEAASELEPTVILQELERSLEALLFPGEEPIEEQRKCPSCDDGRLGLKTGKFGAFIACSNYPDCRYTKQIASDEEGEQGTDFSEPKVLGIDEETGDEISLRKGPYGFYIQLGEGDKPKRTTLPKHISPESLDFDTAQSLVSLPRTLGNHPETEKPIVAGIGRYGPYIQHDGKFVSLKGDDDVLTIGINRAVDLIATKSKGSEPLKSLGAHPEDGKEVNVYEGRYGPYVKHLKVNATIPKDIEPTAITMEQAVELLEKQKAKKKTKKTRSKKK